jgi:hypothetical protein
MRWAVPCSICLLVSFALACGSSAGRLATRVPGETREIDCRPTAEHVPYEVRLPTFLPHGIELHSVCVSPPPPAEGLLDLLEAQLSYRNSDSTAGFLLITTPVDLYAEGRTPIAMGDQQAFTQSVPRDANSANFSIQLRRNDVTYIITATIFPGNRLTEDEVLRIAESIP